MATSLLTNPSIRQSHDHLDKGEAVEILRVLHVINGEHYAGAERVQDLLAAGLGEFGVEVGLACLKPGQFAEKRQARLAPLYEVPMQSRFDFRPVWQLTQIVREHGYRLLHAHTPRTLLVATAVSLLTRVPVVYHVHSPASRDTTHRWRNLLNALIERVCLVLASALITVSGSLKRHVRSQGISDRKISVVHNGVPCRQTPVTADNRRTEWTIGTVALFRPRKGLEVLLEALARVRSQGLPVRLRAVGGFETPEYERQIKVQCAALGLADAVDWTGFTRDVNAELARMDLFVLPSLFGEGLPMVVLEAMAAGVPVLATRVEGIPEAIRDGVDGIIVPAGNPWALATAIDSIVAGKIDCSTLRANASQRQATQFSDRSMAQGVANVYRRVLARRARS